MVWHRYRRGVRSRRGTLRGTVTARSLDSDVGDDEKMAAVYVVYLCTGFNDLGYPVFNIEKLTITPM